MKVILPLVVLFFIAAFSAHGTPTFPADNYRIHYGTIQKLVPESVASIHYPTSLVAGDYAKIDECVIQMFRYSRAEKNCEISSQMTRDVTWWGHEYGVETARVADITVTDQKVTVLINSGASTDWSSDAQTYALVFAWLFYMFIVWETSITIRAFPESAKVHVAIDAVAGIMFPGTVTCIANGFEVSEIVRLLPARVALFVLPALLLVYITYRISKKWELKKQAS